MFFNLFEITSPLITSTVGEFLSFEKTEIVLKKTLIAGELYLILITVESMGATGVLAQSAKAQPQLVLTDVITRG